MRRRAGKRHNLLASVMSVVAVASIGLGSSAASSSTTRIVRGGTLTVALVGASYPGLDPYGPANVPNIPFYYAVFDPLFFPNLNTGGVIPALALSYKTSNAGKTITLQLRRGVRFQDGTPFDADAVVFNIRRGADPNVVSECVQYLRTLQSVKALGRYTVQINFTRPDPSYLSLISTAQCGLMVSPTAVASEGQSFGLHPVGTGPFTMTSFVNGTSYDFTEWNHYWQKGYPLVSHLNFLDFGTDSSAIACVESGQCQLYVASTPTDDASVSGNTVWNTDKDDFLPATILFQLGQPPFNNPIAREAVVTATNENQLISGLELTGSRSLTGPIGPGSWAYPGKSKTYPSFNLSKAKSLVAKIPGGLSFTLETPSTPANIQLAEAVQAQMSEAGIKVTLDALAGTALISDLHTRQFQATMIPPNQPSPPVDPDNIIHRWFYEPTLPSASDSAVEETANTESYYDPVMNADILRSERVFNQTVRSAAYVAVNNQFGKDLPWDMLYGSPTHNIYDKAMLHGTTQGLPNNPTYYPWYSYWVG
jgi:peptide/nickel transport system substrate-binding protein